MDDEQRGVVARSSFNASNRVVALSSLEERQRAVAAANAGVQNVEPKFS